MISLALCPNTALSNELSGKSSGTLVRLRPWLEFHLEISSPEMDSIQLTTNWERAVNGKKGWALLR